MQLTYEGATYLTPVQQRVVHELMRHFQAAKRVAFNCLLKDQPRQTIVERIRRLNLLSNARYIRSAIAQAQALIHSQHELVPLYYRETQWRKWDAQQRLTKYQQQIATHQSPFSRNQCRKLNGLERRYHKARSKYLFWKMHLQNQTFPPVVFGGKWRLRAYQQGKITKAEWQQNRTNGLYCVGEANKQGNANLRIQYHPSTDQFSFAVLMDRGTRNDRISAPLYVPPPFKETFKQHAQGAHPYTVTVKFPPHGAYARVLVASEQLNPTVSNERGIAGLDLNPTGIAVTLVYPDGNFRASHWYKQPKLLYARHGKRKWVVGNLIKRILQWIRIQGINTIAIEALQFSKKYGANPKWNRVAANFVYRGLLTRIHAQALKKGYFVKEINPAFTSMIGKLKYAQLYGLNGHQAAAWVIGRRGLGFSEKLQGHSTHSALRLVVPPMEGWTGKQLTRFARDIDGLTAHLGTPTDPKARGTPSSTKVRRQGSGGGIVPRSHAPTPGKGASTGSGEQSVWNTTT